MDSQVHPQDLSKFTEVGTPKLQAGRVREFTLQELQKAADCFRDENILGKGGFGIVYKGCLADGSLVAIKRLIQEKNTPEGKQQFEREIEMIGMAVHKNLLRLYGFCITPNECLLVYPYMANGSVAARLKGGKEALAPLGWLTRVNVAYGVAKALAYLHDHCNPKIIHRDVKADNILLDDEYEAVVADFGLVRLINYKDSHVTTGVCGTIGHIAPEYFTNLRCSEKTDVYGYGILLLELITGKRVYNIIPPSKRDETMLFDWIRELVKNKDLGFLVDYNLLGNCAYDDIEELVRVALLCTQHSPKERPQMSRVVRMLEDYTLDTEKMNRGSWKHPTKVSQEKLRCFQFYRLEYGTDFFSENNVVGRGSFGKVYKARLEDGSIVTVKRLEEHTSKGELQYKAEALAMKNRIKHPNLLPILGFCKSGQEMMLVYSFMEKGTLSSYLKGYPNSAQFDPQTQKKIALGVARGLNYLHNGAPTIHGDLKAENIWLDESFNAVVGDIGLYHPEDSSLEKATSGTPGYIAPEFLQTNKFTNKTDVFAYGVLLLELLTGLRAFDFYWLSLEGKEFVQGNMLVNVIRFCLREFGYARLDDCKLMSDVAIRKEETEQLLQLALLCTQSSDMNRPTMSKVVEILEGEQWPSVLSWRDVLKEVHFQQDIGKKKNKKVSASHGNETADEEQRMSTLRKWINEFPRMRWWNAIPAINRFPYLKESELSEEVKDGNLSALKHRYADWFGERM